MTEKKKPAAKPAKTTVTCLITKLGEQRGVRGENNQRLKKGAAIEVSKEKAASMEDSGLVFVKD